MTLLEDIRKYYPPGLDILTFSLMFGMFIYVLIFYGNLPTEIPIQFNAAGEAAGWGEKSVLLNVMLIHLLVVLTIFIANYFILIRADGAAFNMYFNQRNKYTKEQMEMIKLNLSRMLATTSLAISIMFCTLHYTLVQSGLGNQGGLGFGFSITLVLIFVPIFYFIRKIYHELKK